MTTKENTARNPFRIVAWIVLIWGLLMPVSSVVYVLLGYGADFGSTRTMECIALCAIGFFGLLLTARK